MLEEINDGFDIEMMRKMRRGGAKVKSESNDSVSSSETDDKDKEAVPVEEKKAVLRGDGGVKSGADGGGAKVDGDSDSGSVKFTCLLPRHLYRKLKLYSYACGRKNTSIVVEGVEHVLKKMDKEYKKILQEDL